MCDVCCEPMKRPIECKICNFTACYKCVTKYLLECTVNPKCMKCEKPWSRKNLVNSFGQYFVSHKYKQKRENVLFELEQAMLPDTQPIAARERRITELNNKIFSLENQLREYDSTINRLSKGILDSEFEEFLEVRKTLRLQRHEVKEEITNLRYRISRLHERSPRGHEKKTSSALVIKCPSETCKGYINTKNGECDLCKTKICKECHVKLEQVRVLEQVPGQVQGLEQLPVIEHTCKPEDLETVKLIQKETKNCPSCKALIYKIDGCDQMFCTQCHSAFSWKTGEICSGRIHNPHYYEYLRARGTDAREMGDIPCGGLPYATRFILDNKFLRYVHQLVSHVENFEIHRMNNELNHVNGNLDLRIAYLNDRLPEIMFKQEIYRREKALEKKREILTIFNTFVVVCADIFRTLVIPESKECRPEFDSIRNFTNESMYDVSRVYKCVVPIIDCNWIISNQRA